MSFIASASTASPAWLDALSIVLGFLQTVILAYLAGQQHASAQERHRRRRAEGLEE